MFNHSHHTLQLFKNLHNCKNETFRKSWKLSEVEKMNFFLKLFYNCIKHFILKLYFKKSKNITWECPKCVIRTFLCSSVLKLKMRKCIKLFLFGYFETAFLKWHQKLFCHSVLLIPKKSYLILPKNCYVWISRKQMLFIKVMFYSLFLSDKEKNP